MRAGSNAKTAMRTATSALRLATTVVSCGLVVFGVVGCVVNEPESPPRGVVVSGPPPAPVPEQRPNPPNQQAVWVPGYWHWTGMQYAWITGHWDAPPPGAIWAAPQVTQKDGRFFYESGGWQNKNAV